MKLPTFVTVQDVAELLGISMEESAELAERLEVVGSKYARGAVASMYRGEDIEQALKGE